MRTLPISRRSVEMATVFLVLLLGLVTAFGFINGLHVTTYTLVLPDHTIYEEFMSGSRAARVACGPSLLIGLISGALLLGFASARWTYLMLDHREGRQRLVPLRGRPRRRFVAGSEESLAKWEDSLEPTA